MPPFRLIAAAALAALVSACATGAPPAGLGGPAPDHARFNAGDFGWSQAKGDGAIAGRLAYREGTTRFTCTGAAVILTPETPWSRRRMLVLYRSDQRAALPAEEVRARTPEAPPGDSTPFIKRTTCDAADHFGFRGLPNGAWYVITIARPVAGAGESVALMRRVVTHDGRTSPADL